MFKDLRLQQIGVLIFVDEDAVELFPDRPCPGFVRNQSIPEHQQIVIVQAVQAIFALNIAFEELLQFFFKVDTPRKDFFENDL